MDLFNHSEISTVSQSDMDQEYGVPHFWDGIAAWMNQHLGTPWRTGQEMIQHGVRYACMESGQHYGAIDEQFIPYIWQDGVEEEEWGSVNHRKVAKVDGEVIGVDVVVGRVATPNQFQRMVKVMSTECVDYFIEFPKLSRKEMEENQQQAVEQ